MLDLSAVSDLPVIEICERTDNESPNKKDCEVLAACLRDTGLVVVRDARVPHSSSARFIDLMEKYFEQEREEKMKDARPELRYQVGVKPEGVETPLCVADAECQELMQSLEGENKATAPSGADPKWRYHWRVGPRPAESEFKQLNAEPVKPAKFPEWAEVMDDWGQALLAATTTVAEMLAVGLDMPPDTFTTNMRNGPHLLAPTGIDLKKYNKLGTVIAGFHTDLNLLTIHGRSRFPGLFAWTRDGVKIPVKVPEGCLLLQAGCQLEHLTGGYIRAGYHEVCISERTLEAARAAQANGSSCWRVSSTMFVHCCSDCTLEPLSSLQPHWRVDAVNKYPAIKAGTQVKEVLEKINAAVVAAAAASK